jgi:hypothetical protein
MCPSSTVRNRILALVLTLGVAMPGLPARAADTQAAAVYATPEAAGDALAAAWQSGSRDELLAVFGSDGEKLVSSGDRVADKFARQRLADAFRQAHRLEQDGSDREVLVLGKEQWPYPMPLVHAADGWRFDVKAGAQQIIDRRVGRNELRAVEICRAYVEAQREYAAKDPMGGGLHEFAQQVASSPGKHDGLYWSVAAGETSSPLGPLVAEAEARGYDVASAKGQAPFHGYYYRILTRQGEHAPGGARDYMVNGHLTRGFALVAFPVRYGDSGIMTFIVNQHGIIFEKNLGPHTREIAGQMTEYDPDTSWKISVMPSHHSESR